MCTLHDECVPVISVSGKIVIPFIQYPSFPPGFSFQFCQDMIDSCAKVVLSDVCLCVWPVPNLVSVIYVSQVHKGILGKMSDDTEISDVISAPCFSDVSRGSVDPGCPGKGLPCCYCTVHQS